MNKLTLAATALAALLAGNAAFAAGEADYVQENRTAFVGQFSRAEVQAELAQAQQRGELLQAGEALGASQGVLAIAGERSRAEVQAEAVAAAHAPNQNLKREAFAGSTIPSAYTNGSLAATRQAAIDAGSRL